MGRVGLGNFLANGQILYSSAVRASPGTYERAVMILNALAREAERRRIALAVNDKEGRIKLEDGHYPSYRQGRGPRVRIGACSADSSSTASNTSTSCASDGF